MRRIDFANSRFADAEPEPLTLANLTTKSLTRWIGAVVGFIIWILIIAWTASVLAARPPSERFTYGFKSSSILAALANAALAIERALDAGVELVIGQCRTDDDVIRAARDCAGILLQYAPITERVVSKLPKLGIVSRIGAGFDTIDTAACARHGVWVANSPDYGVGEVATHALALSLALMRNIVAYHRDIEAGNWHYLSSGKFHRASDMTLGIVGLGRIGKRMAHISRNVFKRVVAYDPHLIDGDFPAYVERARVRRDAQRLDEIATVRRFNDAMTEPRSQ